MKGTIFILLLWLSVQAYGQKITYPIYDNDSIYNILLKDTGNNATNKKAWLNNYADSIRSYANSINSFFPYKPFNKVIIHRQNVEYFKSGNINQINNRHENGKDFYASIHDINELLEIINNPLYFTFAECGTSTTKYEICFMNGNNIVETLKVSCDETQITTNSKIKDMNWQRMKYGAINDKNALERLRKILINSRAYF